ncbi:MAG: SurA N-terminal domain-containing protein [Flavobacteriaceae bacterium]|nr:SurA N-terminal domain-containing protein [Flavobacteriaceae bacterium]
MAVLNKIRQRSVFLIIIIAMALFAFVLADVFQNGGFSSNKEQNTVGTINGTDISRNDFLNKVENALRNMGANATNLQAANAVWNNEVRANLFREQFEKLGLQISDEQLQNALAQNLSGNPTFSNEAGIYDPFKVQEYLADVKENAPQQYAQFVEFEKSLSQNAIEQTYYSLIRAGLTATTFEGKQEHKLENDKVDIEFVQIPFSSIPDEEIEVTEKDIEDYIKRNAKKYEVEAAVDFQYVLFAENPSEDDETTIENEIKELLQPQIKYNSISGLNDTLPSFQEATDIAAFVSQHSEGQFTDRWVFKQQLNPDADTLFSLNKGEVYGPYKTQGRINLAKVTDIRQMADSVKTKHIMISWDGLETAGSNSRTKEGAKSLADSLLNVIKRDASKFEDLAIQFSDDPGVEENKGDLGYLTPGSVSIKEFNDFAFENNRGDIEIIETELGYFIIKIEEQKNIQKAIKVAYIVKTIQPSEQTLNQTFTEATRFESKALSTDFISAAKEDEISDVRPVNRVGELEENIPGIGANREIVNWAFEKETKVGAIKRFNVNNGYAIVQLTNKNPKGLMPASEASAQVTPLVRNEKKAKRILDNNKATTLEELASANNVQVKRANALNRKSPLIPDAGTEPKVVGTAFGLSQGQSSGLIEGKNGIYMVRVLSTTEAAQREDFTSYITQINNRRASNINATVFNALKKKAKIEDRRANLY